MVEVKPTPTGQSLRIICQNHGVVALVKNGGDHKLANANLMAEAPNLLAALGAAAEQLRTLLDESLEEDYSVLTSAETAIAKAQGA